MKSYLQLFISSIKAKNSSPGRSVVVLFTSSESGEGVTYVVNSFAAQLARKTRQRTVVADAAGLQKADIFHYTQVAHVCEPTDLPNLYVLPKDIEEDRTEVASGMKLSVKAGKTKLERGINNLQTLRFAFDFVLVDCSALSESGDAALLASAADGVVLVVEANRVRKEQVDNSLKLIKRANGKLIGCVMNKRRYPVPNWLYQRI